MLLFVACASPPVAEFTVTTDSGNAPFDVTFLLGELADADSYSWDFGDGSGSTDIEPTHSFEFTGDFVVTLTAVRGDVIDTEEITISVGAGEAGWVVIEESQSSVTSFNTVEFLAIAFDVLGNPIEEPNFVWSVDESVGDIDSNGKFTAATDLGMFKDAISVEFERLGSVVSASTGIEIIEGPLNAFSVVPSVIDLQVGRSETIAVQTVDEAGHVLDSALVLFTALRDGDTVDSTGLFKPSTVASEENVELVSIEVELDGKLIEATISGTIHPGILDELHVSSLPTSLAIGETYQLSAFATDRFGNELQIEELDWSIANPDIGSISIDGLFTVGTSAGVHTDSGITARATLNDIEAVGVAPVTISTGIATSIHIVPDTDSVPIGAGSPFVVIATDEHGNILDVAEEEFEYEYSSAGRGNEVAVFIAGYEIGDFENAITVTLPAGIAENDEAIVAQSDITVRQRSSNIIAVETVDQDGGGIFFIDLETAQLGSADTSFNNNGFVELAPSWWPGGSKLIYVSDPTGQLQAYSLDMVTREIVQLTDFDGGVSMPNISPDGKSIVFVSLEGDRWGLFTADIPEDVSTNPITLEMSTLISEDDTAQHILPFWSPDRTQILASQNTTEGLVRVMVFDPSLQLPPQVLGPFGSVGFGWAPDGSGIHIGLVGAGGALEIGTLDLESSNPVFVDTNLEFLVADWSPDGSEVMGIDSLLGAGWLVDTDSTGLRRVVDSQQVPTRMSWRPTEYGDPVAVPSYEGDPEMLVFGDEVRAPIGALDTSLSYNVVISTDAGDIELELYDDLAPMAVENFVNLSRLGFYAGLEFHRVLAGFMSQAGDPDGDDEGPGYTFNDEFNRGLSHDSAGVLSMANAGSNTNGSQFFITHDAANWLDAYEDGVSKNCADDLVSCHTVFGRVTSGLEIVTSMAERDPINATTPGVKILSILIIES
ncbi:MAG: PKD domain-containing protein [Chloroflexi bacterium]|nr:PKD domain-containing protein [Chloroflexota bacterium]